MRAAGGKPGFIGHVLALAVAAGSDRLDNAKGAVARLASVEVPKHEDTEQTFDELKVRVSSLGRPWPQGRGSA
jgi:hypothetical protein